MLMRVNSVIAEEAKAIASNWASTDKWSLKIAPWILQKLFIRIVLHTFPTTHI